MDTFALRPDSSRLVLLTEVSQTQLTQTQNYPPVLTKTPNPLVHSAPSTGSPTAILSHVSRASVIC